MEQAVEDIENKMKDTDARLDTLALQVGNIELEIFSENGQDVEVHNLLKSVSEVKDNYQNLRKEILEVQDLQKQLSSSLNTQLKMMQTKFNRLKEKISVADQSRFVTRSPAKFVEDSK
ncbi:nuclear distribution protein nudE homolog 1-A [Euwallacea similis]|uniref:nuclear distribution protein nudE homolog 1-A n=1 Tax=Euwallacea similis TaxID=1736056 RepID=UPI00344B36E4